MADFGNIYDFEIPKITNGNQFKTVWKPRLLFFNGVEVTTPLKYGLDTHNEENTTNINNWYTFSNKYNYDQTDSGNLNLAFGAKESYADLTPVTNHTLYNKYYSSSTIIIH